jgi:hypothetical protein
MVVLGLAQITLGTIGALSEGEPYSFVISEFGAVIVCFSLLRLQEARLDALQELLRLSESCPVVRRIGGRPSRRRRDRIALAA